MTTLGKETLEPLLSRGVPSLPLSVLTNSQYQASSLPSTTLSLMRTTWATQHGVSLWYLLKTKRFAGSLFTADDS